MAPPPELNFDIPKNFRNSKIVLLGFLINRRNSPNHSLGSKTLDDVCA